jgi:sialate O-acetylesterase
MARRTARWWVLGVVMAASVWFGSGEAEGQAAMTAPVFSDHMVLQREMPVPVWGWGTPGETVTVKIAGHEASGAVGDDGRWMLKLPPMQAGGPHEMTVTCGGRTVRFEDVLVGEVWLASGQSNMEMGLHAVENGEAECAAADHPRIRLFGVAQRPSGQPRLDVHASWQPCTPETVRVGPFDGFSAVAYYFGRRLHDELDVPIGLIDSSWGGTRIEPWIPPEGFSAVPELKPFLQEIAGENEAYRRNVAASLDAIQNWINAARAAIADGTEIPVKPPIPVHALESNWRPTGLYNGMIHPLIPYAIRGVIWYQGESNAMPYDGQYVEKMQALVGGWRTLWGEGDFPFYYVQIAPFNLRLFIPDVDVTHPVLIREQQLEALSVIANAGMVVTMDIGHLRDIHPRNKRDVGERLARWALAETYGRDGIVYSGPIHKAMTVEGSKIRVTFEHVGSGLASRDGKPLTWFEIAGADKVWHEATAEIDGDTVVVWSDKVEAPVTVRYGWGMTAEPNLMNKEGLPAAPFRTHKW